GCAQAQIVVDQLLLVLLDAGNVGADRNVTAVLCAAFADVQPASIVELGLEGACAGDLAGAFLVTGADLRHAADLDHGLIGGAGDDGGVRQLVQLLEVRVAEHEAVAGVPQHEGLGNGFDGVAQPQVGLDGLLGKALLLGDVDGNPDQVQPAFVGAATEFAADPQPDPVPAGMLHAEGLVDVIEVAGDEPIGNGKQVNVVGLHQGVDLAEGQEVAARVEAEHREHRLRPENPSAGEIPVPQAATAA